VLEGAAIERVWLADSGNVSPSAYSSARPFRTEYMNDGDFSTHWTSQSWNDGNWARSKQVFASFTRPADLSSVIWVPRLDGEYSRNLRLYTVTVWRQGDDLNGPGTLVSPNPLQGGSASDHNTWLGVGNDPAVTKFAVLPFEPVTDVVKIAVAIEQAAYTAVSLSELMFVEYDPARCLPDNIADLFADELRTALRPGVSQADVDGLRRRLESGERNYYMNLDALADELDLAEELLESGSSSGVVLSGVQSRSGGADSRKYQQGGSDLQPLGAAAGARQELTIYASGIPAGQKLTVYASQFNAEASAWRSAVGTLSNGRNVLTVPQIGSQNTPRGGSLYLSYGGTNPEGIRLHIRRGTDIPVLELSDWHAMSDSRRREELGRYASELEAYAAGLTGDAQTNFLNVTELSTPTMLLSLPAAAVLNGAGRSREERIETLYQAVLAWEDVMHICKTTQGIDSTYGQNDMQTRQNIRCMQMFSGAFMYAAGSHIGIGYGSCAGMVCGKPIASMGSADTANRLFGWGIAHEIGHNMDKLGQAEITNNLYSLMVQTFDGKQNTLASRLEKSGKYAGIFSKT
ncbi:MAG: M60 family metallopeptidase, partial [Dysosmobacter sp.]|nr:M60 family metallopeptidase [Dysosmobacter sp.]